MTTYSGQMVCFGRLVNALALALLSLWLPVAASGVLASDASARPIRIVVLGDSLSAGFGLKAADAFPAQLERLLKAKGYAIEIVNAGVSGDTTTGGLARLDWAVPDGVDAVILELGANDALRGQPPATARANLDTIIARLRARGIDVLIAGMRAPRNLGNDYANAFDSIFPELAEKHGALLYPFFLTGVALDPKLNLDDGMHPNTRGIAVIAERILPSVEDLISRVKARRAATSKG